MGSHAYTIPLLTDDIIIEELRFNNINITVNDLKKPDARRWIDFYSQIYTLMTDKSIEDAVQRFIQVSALKLPGDGKDMYDEVLYQTGFTICMQRVLFTAGFQDFSLQDSIEPTRKRLIHLLSSVINKIRHCIATDNKLTIIKKTCEESKDKLERVLNENKDLKLQWERTMDQNEQRQKEIAENEEQLEQQNAQMAEIDRQRMTGRRLQDDQKLKISEKEALKEKLKCSIKEGQQEQEKLSQKIVPSPERFKQDQEVLKKKVAELKEEISLRLEKKITEKAVPDHFTNINNVAGKALRLAKEVLADVEISNKHIEENVRKEEVIQERSDELSGLYRESDDLKETIAVRQSQKHTLSHQLDVKKQVGQHQKGDVQRNHEIYQEKRDSTLSLTALHRKEASECYKKVKLLAAQCEELVGHWHNDKAELYQEVDIFHKNLESCLIQVQANLENES